MWKPPVRRSAAPARPGGRHVGPMARSRRLAGRRVLVCAVLGGAATLALTQLITLSNSVIATRADVERLRRDKAFLEGSLGRLEGEWNRRAARDSVVARAQRELKLVLPAADEARVMVVSGPPAPGPAPWRRVLGTLGGAEAVATATAGEKVR